MFTTQQFRNFYKRLIYIESPSIDSCLSVVFCFYHLDEVIRERSDLSEVCDAQDLMCG
jgi:hypothetical protein